VEEILVVAGARTPFTEFGGTLADVGATELAAVAARGALERSAVAPEQVDNVVFGNALQSSNDAMYLARHAGLRAGVRIETPALTVNRLCGSGLQALVSAAQAIRLGESEVALAGGTESMSQIPHVIYGARTGLPLGKGKLHDLLWEALYDTQCRLRMPETAEAVARDHHITREACDELALRSHRLAAAARASGRLAREIVPVTLRTRKGEVKIERDEHIREDVSAEALARLEARFVEGGVVTAGNSSGINDGAAALVLASGTAAARLGLRPMGRLVSWAVAGVEPSRMGLGPVPASRKALERAGLGIGDLDVVEINEAFAAQYLAVERLLELDRSRTNVNGGAIALGHPLGSSGARVALTLLHELRARQGRYGLASLCIGGGQGIAAVFEAF
jgi:acetyl-CoA acetyltransferase family protein